MHAAMLQLKAERDQTYVLEPEPETGLLELSCFQTPLARRSLSPPISRPFHSADSHGMSHFPVDEQLTPPDRVTVAAGLLLPTGVLDHPKVTFEPLAPARSFDQTSLDEATRHGTVATHSPTSAESMWAIGSSAESTLNRTGSTLSVDSQRTLPMEADEERSCDVWGSPGRYYPATSSWDNALTICVGLQ
jgi:hypothetical protein